MAIKPKFLASMGYHIFLTLRYEATVLGSSLIFLPPSRLSRRSILFVIITGLKMVCRFSTVGGVSLVIGMGYILKQASQGSLEEFVHTFTTVILPPASKLLSMGGGSMCFTVQAENSSALKELWDRYQDGSLRRDLQEFLVTDDIRQTADGEEVEVTVSIDEQEYNDVCLSLFLAEKQGK